jgi:hypothetical protein
MRFLFRMKEIEVTFNFIFYFGHHSRHRKNPTIIGIWDKLPWEDSKSGALFSTFKPLCA